MAVVLRKARVPIQRGDHTRLRLISSQGEGEAATPIDLTGAMLELLVARDHGKEPSWLYTSVDDPDVLEFEDAAEGAYLIRLSPDLVASWGNRSVLVWQLRAVFPSGDRETLAQGLFDLDPAVSGG